MFNFVTECFKVLAEEYKARNSNKTFMELKQQVNSYYSKEEEKGFLAQIKNVLEEDGYRVKAQKGLNYDFYQQN